MKQKKAVFAGSFDPITLGHLDLIKRGVNLFDELHVVIAESPDKTNWLSTDLRKQILEKIFESNPNVVIGVQLGLVANYCERHGVDVLLRGIRNSSDLLQEQSLAWGNKFINENLETYWLPSSNEWLQVSSSLVRELVKYKENIQELIPKESWDLLNEKGYLC